MAESLRFDVIGKGDASDLVKLAAAIDSLTKQLHHLDRVKAEPTVAPKTKQAEKDIGAFATSMRKKLEAAVKALPEIEITADSSDADLEIAAIRKDLAELADKRVGIDIDATLAQAQIEQLTARLRTLGAESADVAVQADTAAAVAALGVVEAQVEKIDGKTARVKVDVDKSLSDSIVQVAALGRALGQLALPAAAIAAAPQLAAIGAAAVTASGALWLLPAAAGAGATAIGALAVGLSGVADALGETDTPAKLKKVNEAIASLAPSARAAVQEIRSLGPAWTTLRLEVQGRLFEGLAGHIDKLAGSYLPMLRRNLGDVAGSFNYAAQEIGRFLAERATVADLAGTFGNFENVIENVTKAFAPLTRAFVDLASVGSGVLVDLTDGAGAAAERFATFIETARGTGQLEQWMRQGVDAIAQLGRIAGDVGGILHTVFTAAETAGASFLDTAERITSGVRDFLNSTEGNTALVSFFTSIRETIDALEPGVKALALAVVDVVQNLSNAGVLREAGAALSEIAEAAAPVLRLLGEIASAVLPPLLRGLGEVAPLLTPIATGILAIVAASKGLTAFRALGTGLATALSGVAPAATTASTAVAAVGTSADKAATSGGRLSTVMSRIGGALPAIGVALLGVGVYMDHLDQQQQALADGMLKGGSAAEKATRAYEAQSMSMGIAAGWQQLFGTSVDDVRQKVEAQERAMSPLEQAQLRVTRATQALTDAQNAQDPRALATAQAELEAATRGLEVAQHDAEAATRGQTGALIDQHNQMMAQASARISHEQSVRSLEQAEKDVAAAIRDHGKGSEEAKLAEEQRDIATLRAIESAGRLAYETSNAKNEIDRQKASTDAQRLAILDMASSVEGRGNPMLQDLARKFSDAELAAWNASVKTSGFHHEVRILPDGREVLITTPRIAEVIRQVQALKGEINGIVGRSVMITVDAAGRAIASASERAGQISKASGGILPGFTPGRDVHRFVGPAGTLNLSGGEAVMRPEFTRALGAGWINAANAAARKGGIGAVQDFVARTAPREGEGQAGDGAAFAQGGVIPVEIAGKYSYSGDSIPKIWASLVADWQASQGGNVLAWARTQVGKPYLWGGVGPGGYDCSGFMSALVNVARGKNPHSRVGATGNFPWAGFKPGTGPGLNIGSFRGNPGHMAGTIGGTNVESSGGRGVTVGGGVGVNHPMFNVRAHLPFDRGGRAYGRGIMLKDVIEPERVLSNRQNQAFERLVDVATGKIRAEDGSLVPASFYSRPVTAPSQNRLNFVEDARRLGLPTSGGLPPGWTIGQDGRISRAGDVIRPPGGSGPSAGAIGAAVSAALAGVNARLEARFGELSERLAMNRSITVEDRSGNPLETARAMQLAMRLAR